MVHNSSDDSDDDYFEYTFHGDSNNDLCIHEMEYSTSKATSTSSDSELGDLEPDNFVEAYSHSDLLPFPGDSNDDNLCIHEMEYSTSMATSTSSDLELEKDLEPDNFVEAYSHSDPLPLPGVSPEWYEKQRAMKFIMPQESNVEVHMLQRYM